MRCAGHREEVSVISIQVISKSDPPSLPSPPRLAFLCFSPWLSDILPFSRLLEALEFSWFYFWILILSGILTLPLKCICALTLFSLPIALFLVLRHSCLKWLPMSWGVRSWVLLVLGMLQNNPFISSLWHVIQPHRKLQWGYIGTPLPWSLEFFMAGSLYLFPLYCGTPSPS